jgi:EAL domain-containing protein (putative c-di-GMP-specific phosphodiesterase class I)
MEAMTHDSADETAPETSARTPGEDSPGVEAPEVLFQPRVDLYTGRPAGCEIIAARGDGDLSCPLDPMLLPGAVAALTGIAEKQPGFRICWRAPSSLPDDERAVEAIRAAAARADTADCRLFVEVREGDLTDAPASWSKTLGALRAADIGIAFADFGAGFLRATKSDGAHGFETLEAIARMPCDEIQIAWSLADSLPTDRTAATALRACIEFAHELGRTVAATWVERPVHARIAQDFGLDFGQGGYFSEPLDRDALAEWVDYRLRVFGDNPNLAPFPIRRRGRAVGA